MGELPIQNQQSRKLVPCLASDACSMQSSEKAERPMFGRRPSRRANYHLSRSTLDPKSDGRPMTMATMNRQRSRARGKMPQFSVERFLRRVRAQLENGLVSALLGLKEISGVSRTDLRGRGQLEYPLDNLLHSTPELLELKRSLQFAAE